MMPVIVVKSLVMIKAAGKTFLEEYGIAIPAHHAVWSHAWGSLYIGRGSAHHWARFGKRDRDQRCRDFTTSRSFDLPGRKVCAGRPRLHQWNICQRPASGRTARFEGGRSCFAR